VWNPCLAFAGQSSHSDPPNGETFLTCDKSKNPATIPALTDVYMMA
jgi:hypothetical protein